MVKNLLPLRETQALIPGSGRSPGEGNSNPLHYSCLENPMDKRAWRAAVHGVTKSQTRLSDQHTDTSRRLTFNLILPEILQPRESLTGPLLPEALSISYLCLFRA